MGKNYLSKDVYKEARRRAEEERRAREAREAEERRRAEEERRAREAREAEERRRAEAARRAREAREAEERRRAEEERRARAAEERRQQIKTQEEETWRLLEAGKWDEAAAAADRIPSSDRGDKALLMLLAKYHLPSIAALAGSDEACSDPLFDEAVRAVLDEERREQLQKIAQEARQRREKKAARAEFRGRLFPALGAVLLMLASAVLPLLLPDHAGRITLGVELVALVLMCVYDVLVWRNAGVDNDECCDLIIAGDVGCAVLLIALLCVSLFVHLPMWETLALAFAGALVMACVLTGVRAGMAESGCRAVRAHVFYTGLPLLWLVLHLAGRLLLCVFTPGWLVVVANVVTYGLGGVVLLTTLVNLGDKCDR